MRSCPAPRPLILGTRTDVDRLYRAFDLFLLNSLGEGMSNTLLEAMASGLPIVCTPVGGNKELLASGHSGTFIKPGDDSAAAAAIREYMSLPTMRAAHGQNARSSVVEHFSLHRMIHRYVELYEAAA